MQRLTSAGGTAQTVTIAWAHRRLKLSLDLKRTSTSRNNCVEDESMRTLTEKTSSYCTIVRPCYTDEELRAAWNERGQGHCEAVERGPLCVVVECDEEAALLWTRVFCERLFNIPTCVHYDGRTVSMYCGDGSAVSAFKAKLESFSVS
jgi:hypothetical protein